MNELSLFENDERGTGLEFKQNEISVINQQNVLGKDFKIFGTFENPLFLAKDVAEWIEYSKRPDGSYNVSAMLASIDEDEKTKLHTAVNNLNGGSDSWFLTENGLYEVLMLSRKPIAKEFKKQVKKILHELRTKGEFRVPRTMKEALQIALEQQERIEQQERMLLEQAPKVAVYDRICEASGLKTMREVAKNLGMGSRTLFSILRDNKVLYLDNGVNLPMQKYIESGYFVTREELFSRDGKNMVYTRIYITAKGEIWLAKNIKNKEKVIKTELNQ